MTALSEPGPRSKLFEIVEAEIKVFLSSWYNCLQFRIIHAKVAYLQGPTVLLCFQKETASVKSRRYMLAYFAEEYIRDCGRESIVCVEREVSGDKAGCGLESDFEEPLTARLRSCTSFCRK